MTLYSNTILHHLRIKVESTTEVEVSPPIAPELTSVVAAGPSIDQMLTIFDAAISTPNYGRSEEGGDEGIAGGLSVPNFAYEIVDDDTVCMDDQGKERSYGECWNKKEDSCQVCTCYDQDDTRCEAKECPQRPMCTFGQRLVIEQTDKCCKTYRCVEREYLEHIELCFSYR